MPTRMKDEQSSSDHIPSAKLHDEMLKNKYSIQVIQNDIESIKNNHLKHIQDDMESVHKKVDKLDDKIDKKVDKLDGRLWWIIGILIAATIVPMIKDAML